jgi:hypothetical protein
VNGLLNYDFLGVRSVVENSATTRKGREALYRQDISTVKQATSTHISYPGNSTYK